MLSPDRIRDEINLRMQHPFTKRQMVKKTKLSLPVAAFIEYLLDLFPFWFEKGKNKTKIGSNNNALIFYRRHFPPGTLGFKVPCASAIEPNPCPNYKAIEGRTFYLVRWELNIPDIELRCHVVESNIYNQCEGTLTD